MNNERLNIPSRGWGFRAIEDNDRPDIFLHRTPPEDRNVVIIDATALMTVPVSEVEDGAGLDLIIRLVHGSYPVTPPVILPIGVRIEGRTPDNTVIVSADDLRAVLDALIYVTEDFDHRFEGEDEGRDAVAGFLSDNDLASYDRLRDILNIT